MSSPTGQLALETQVRPGASLSVLLLTLALGFLATAVAFRYVVRQDEQRIEAHVDTAVAAIAAASTQATYTLPVFEALGKVFTQVQEDVAKGVPMTRQQLRGYLWEKPIQGLETTSLEFLPRVPAAELTSRSNAKRLMGFAEQATQPVVEEGRKGLQPATPRSDYFPVLLEAGYGNDLTPAGLDRANQPDYLLPMLQARDTGMMSSHSYFPEGAAASESFQTTYYFPLYRSGSVPATVEERREQLLGFVSAVTRYPASAMYDFLPVAYHGISADFIALQAPGENLAALDPLVAGHLARPDVKQAFYDLQGLHFGIIASASDSLRDDLTGNTRWWILGLGSLVNLWMLSLLLWSHRQGSRIVALVNLRTRDLADRTYALTVANSALRQSEQRYRMLADNISDVIFTCDMDGHFTFVSPSIRTLSGYAPEDLLGSPFYSHLDLPSATQAQESFGKMLTSLGFSRTQATGSQVHEYQVLCKDGSRRHVETTLAVLPGDDGHAIGFVGAMRDISERKRIEKEKDALQQAWGQTQKLEAIGTLAGGIAHDFNNLLTGVLGHADMLKSDISSTPEAQHSLSMIETAAIRAKELTSQLLGFARKGKFMQVPVDINAVLTDLTGLLERTIDKNIQISRISCAGSPIVLGDPSQINQIFLNLAVNARDAMPKGGNLNFKTEILHIDDLSRAGFGLAPGDYCAVSVSDTGVGIDAAKLERIFEPFFTDKEEGKGTGLGLAMVYGVVKNHKGAVRVYSEPGKGSIFKVFLPLHATGSGEKRRPQARSLIKGTGRILLVDDQPLVRQVGEKMLQQLGYDVVLKENGLEGLDYYRTHWQEIDVVLIDMIMPKMGGLECLDGMKQINPDLKAILSTGFSREDIAEKIKQSHILGFIQKPYRLQELSEVIAGVKQRGETPA